MNDGRTLLIMRSPPQPIAAEFRAAGPRANRNGLEEPGLRGQAARTLRKYWRIFRASLIERMVYRADFFVSTVLRFLPMVTTILLWQAIYAGAGADQLEGFSYHDMIAYL